MAGIFALRAIGNVFCGLVAFLHFYFFLLETILWRQRAKKVFRLKEDVVDKTANMAANQGFYNLILSAGLVWALCEDHADPEIKSFFLASVICCGVIGGVTVSRIIFYVQLTPALLGLLFIEFGYKDIDDFSTRRNPIWTLLIVFGGMVGTYIISAHVRARERKFKNRSASSQGLVKENASA